MRKSRLSRISTADLRRELDRRAASASTLETKRIALADELSRIDAEIGALSGDALSIGPTATKRPHSRITSRSLERG